MEFSYYWFIENYSHCWHKNGETLNSPEFTIDTLHDAKWIVSLYPRGKCKKTANFISLYLKKNSGGVDPEVPFRYELSLLSEDGSVLCRKTHEDVLQCEYPKLVKIDEVLERKRVDYLLNGTLNVRLKIRLGEAPIKTISRTTARTHIAYLKHYFVHVVKNFSQLELNQTDACKIDFNNNEIALLNTTLYRTDDSSTEDKIMCSLKSSTIKFIYKCELNVFDASLNEIQHFSTFNQFDSSNDDIVKFPLSISKQEVMANKDVYLNHEDGLIISCEIIFSTGEKFERIKEYTFAMSERAERA